MALQKYLVRARRRLQSEVTTRITKAIEEESPTDALIEFCNLLGISPQMLDNPDRMGGECWDVFICTVSDRIYADARQRYNRDPVRRDFRAGCRE